MADHVFIGTGTPTREKYTLVVGGTIEAGDEFRHTINGKLELVAASTTNADTTASEIQARLAALKHPEFSEFESSVSGATVTVEVKAAHAGKPITLTTSTTEAGGGAADTQTYVQTNTVVNDGPNVLKASNLSGGVLPSATDSLYFQESAVDLKYALTAISAVGTLTLLDIQASYTGKIGLPRRNKDQALEYNEYRPRYLDCDATNVRIGWGEGNGSPRIMLDLGSVLTTVTVYKSAASEDTGYHAIRLKATNASNALVVYGGTVDIAPDENEVSTFATISVYGGKVRTSAGVTHGNIFVGGTGIFEANVRTGTVVLIEVTDNGHATVYSTQAITNIYVRSGTFVYKGSGTITQITVGPTGKFDASQNPNNFTVTGAVVLYAGAKFYDPNKKGTYSTAWQFHCDPNEVEVKLGKRFNATISIVT